jgi:hypothetical protein
MGLRLRWICRVSSAVYKSRTVDGKRHRACVSYWQFYHTVCEQNAQSEIKAYEEFISVCVYLNVPPTKLLGGHELTVVSGEYKEKVVWRVTIHIG